MLPWKFVISMNTGSFNELTTVRFSEIGYTAIKNTSANATEIKVLQILPYDDTNNLVVWYTLASAFIKLDYAAINKETEYTDHVFDCVTFKKRNLTILD
ncbi:MAG: hypothetical protein ACI4D7_10430 [Lachnospiraceae bacterium]